MRDTGTVDTVQILSTGPFRIVFLRANAIPTYLSGGPVMRASLFGTGISVVLVMASATAVLAQPSPSPLNGWDNAYYQILAESLRRAGKGNWVSTSDGYAIGRIVDVRTAPDGMHEIVVVNVRRLMGGGEIALPIDRLVRNKGRILAKDDRAAIRSMARIDRVPTGRS